MKERSVTPHTLRLVKDGQLYVLRYAPGCESRIVEEITRLASDPRCDLDWMDAASLSFQITQYLAIR